MEIVWIIFRSISITRKKQRNKAQGKHHRKISTIFSRKGDKNLDKKIRGISIQFGADMSPIGKALKDVEKTSSGLNAELRKVNKLLKFDPGNTTLLAQKQQILSESIENTQKKLTGLKQAQSEVEKMFKSGDIGEKEYREFQRTLEETEQSLKSYTTQMNRMQEEQKKFQKGTKELNTFLEATGKGLDDFQDVLGTKLTNALKNGTANSDDLTIALNKMAKEALGAETDLSEVRNVLNKIDDGSSLDEVSQDLRNMKSNSDDAEESLGNIGKGITSGNLMQAAEIIADAGQKIKGFSDNAKEAFREVDSGADAVITATGATGEFAESLNSVYENLVSSFPTDNLESIGQAIGEVNTQFGFTDERLQNASEFMLKFADITGSDVVTSTQNAKQAISEFRLSGDDLESVLDSVAKTAQDTGVSVDDLFNNVISGAPNLQELGLTFDQSVKLLGNFEQAGVDSSSALNSLSKAAVNYAKDGKSLTDGLAETQEKILGAKNQTEALNAASEVFGTKGAVRMVDAIQRGTLNLEELGKKSNESQGTVSRTFEDTLDPIDKETVAANNAKLAMAEFGNTISEVVAPILEIIVPIIKSVAKWFGGLSDTTKTIIVVVGIVITTFMALLPIIAAVSTAIGVAGGAMALLTGTLLPVIGIIAGVVAVITIVITVIKNWGAITDWLSEKWQAFKDWISGIWEGIAETIQNVWTGITDWLSEKWQAFKDWMSGIWEGIAETIQNVWTGIKDFFQTIWDAIYSVIEVPLNLIKSIIEGVMYAIYAVIYTVWEVIKFALKAAWDWISSTASAVFTPIVEFFSGIWNTISTAASTAWETIKGALATAWDWIGQTASAVFTPIANFFSGVWNGIKDVAVNIWNTIKDTLGGIWGGIKDKATEVFSSLWKFIKEGFNSLKDTLGGIVSGIANGIISPIGGAINGVIKGVNWILDRVGSKKQFDLWEIPKFARGAAGLPEDTIGIVNDQKGSVYKELIVPPDGKPFIPEGRDVVLPMKKGTKILPANETKNLFSVLPHFANGIGDFFSGLWESVSSFTGNVLDYIQHPKKIVQIAIDKFTDLSGIVEPWLSVTTGAVNSVVDNITDFVKEIFDKELTVKYNASAGVEQWRGLAEKALRMTGQYSEANLQRLLYQMQTESGGNPNAINNWDSNAAAGIPSKGLMQVIDPTFRAYAMQGYNTNIYDPLSNMLASIRYAVATYGSLERAYRGVGYKEGIGNIDLSKLFSVPSLDIRYFKEGGILTKPRVFSTGHGIGVAGEGTQNEAIAPVQKLKEYIQDSILEILGSKNIEISIDMTGYMDGRAVAKGQAHYIQPMIKEKEKLQRWLRGDEKWGY